MLAFQKGSFPWKDDKRRLALPSEKTFEGKKGARISEFVLVSPGGKTASAWCDCHIYRGHIQQKPRSELCLLRCLGVWVPVFLFLGHSQLDGPTVILTSGCELLCFCSKAVMFWSRAL